MVPNAKLKTMADSRDAYDDRYPLQLDVSTICQPLDNSTDLNNSASPNHTVVDHSAFDIPTYTFIIVTVLYGLMFVAGVIGNIMVIFVVTKNRAMRNSTNMFLTNLSVSDLLVIVICMPSSLLEFYMKDVWLLGDCMCRLVPFLENTVSHASLLTIVGIGVDRYYAIRHPIRARSMCTTRHAGRTIITIWLLAITLTSPFLAFSYTDSATFYDGSTVTVCRTSMNHVGKRAYVVSMILIFLLAPFAVLTCLCLMITRYLRLAKSIRSSQSEEARSESRLSVDDHRQKAVYLLVAILVLFMISVIPIRVVTLWILYSTVQEKEMLGLEGYLNIICFSRILFYLNSIANPVLYNMLSTRFHEAFKRAMSKKYRLLMRRPSSGPSFYSYPLNRLNNVPNGDFRKKKLLVSMSPVEKGDILTTVDDGPLDVEVRDASLV